MYEIIIIDHSTGRIIDRVTAKTRDEVVAVALEIARELDPRAFVDRSICYINKREPN